MTELKLGRTFKDLLDENYVEVNSAEEILEIPLGKIKPNPEQPRRNFDIESLKELAESIKEHGVIQPVIVKPAGDYFILVAGERRVRASKLAGLDFAPAIVRDYNAIYLAELAILENLQREDLTPIEEAIAYNKLLSGKNLTHEELATKIGKSRTYVTNTLGLLNLPAALIDDVNDGVLSMGHARALSKLEDIDQCLLLRDRIVNEKLSVRDIEKIIRNMGKKAKVETVSTKMINDAKTELKSYINKDIKYKVSKNSISFKFKDEDELVKLLEFLKRG
mgnify:CR=1 FL=1